MYNYTNTGTTDRYLYNCSVNYSIYIHYIGGMNNEHEVIEQLQGRI